MLMILKNNIKFLSSNNFNRFLLSKSFNKQIKYTFHLETTLAYSSTKNYNTKSLAKPKLTGKQQLQTEDDRIRFGDSSERQFQSFEQEIKFRHNQAKRSLLFKLDNKFQNKKEQIQNLLNDFKTVRCQVQEALLLGSTNNSFVLVEFKSINCVNKILEKYSKPFRNVDTLPTTTRLIYYTSKPIRNLKSTDSKLPVRDFTDLNLKDYDYESIETISNINDQIRAFYEFNKIDDLGYRLRYFVGAILEESIGGIFQNCLCLPFGSSMNKFGARIADLDLACSLNGNKNLKSNIVDEALPLGNFYFLTNTEEKKVRRKNFNVFELIEIIICNLIPKFRFVQAIPHARVPIIKFEAQIGHVLSCDLSMSNVEVSYLMTKLFWTYCKMDERVACIVFLLRHWSLLTGIKTSLSPSPSLTSFQLTCLVLYYLIKLDKPLISPIDDILDKKQYANLIRFEKYQENVNEQEEILSNLTINDQLPQTNPKNTSQLIELIDGFFRFYANFDFNKNVIALSKQPLNKPVNNNKLFIENPFMPSLNASQNVTANKLAYFKDICQLSTNLINKSKSNLNLNRFFCDLKSLKNVKTSNRIEDEKSIFDDMNL